MKNRRKIIKREWHLIDAKGKILGRLASRVALLLQGKNKPGFVPHCDQGDWVVVINATQIKVSGRKKDQKVYYRYSGYPGGIKARVLREVFAQDPAWVLKNAVKGMLPKNKLQKQRLQRLKVFPLAEHSYQDKFKK